MTVLAVATLLNSGRPTFLQVPKGGFHIKGTLIQCLGGHGSTTPRRTTTRLKPLPGLAWAPASSADGAPSQHPGKRLRSSRAQPSGVLQACCILTPRGSLLCCNKLRMQPVLSRTKQLTPTSTSRAKAQGQRENKEECAWTPPRSPLPSCPHAFRAQHCGHIHAHGSPATMPVSGHQMPVSPRCPANRTRKQAVLTKHLTFAS